MPTTHQVQLGETPMRITQRYVIDPTRFGELIAANPHKPRVIVDGTVTFRDLTVGEVLHLPWTNGTHASNQPVLSAEWSDGAIGQEALVPVQKDALARAFGEKPALVSGVLHGGIGSAVGATAGALAGLLLWPAHIGALALAGGAGVGSVAAAYGWQAGDRVRSQVGLPEGGPTKIGMLAGYAHDALTVSTGSLILDTAVGGVVGYALTPTFGWTLAGSVLTGLGGVVGLGLLAGANLISKRI